MPRRKLLLYLANALMAGGILALAAYGYLRFEMFRVQKAASRALDLQTTGPAEPIHARSVPHAVVIATPRAEEPIGRMEISRLGVSVMVLEGTAPKTLRVAAGHISGTALPGIRGNIGIAAHRDTFFRPLGQVRPKDTIVLTTSYGKFRYVVNAVDIVDPSDVQVLRRTSDAELTLVTCYPFYYVGSAPKRFVVHARQLI